MSAEKVIETVVDKAPEIMDKTPDILDKATEFAGIVGEKISSIISQYGGDAWNMVEMVVRVNLLSELFMAFVGFSFFLWAYLYFAKKMLAWSEKEKNINSHCYRDGSVGLGVVMYFLGGGVISFLTATFIFGANKLFNLWIYFGIYEPKLWLAKQALDKVLN